jgi:hypothetical protein
MEFNLKNLCENFSLITVGPNKIPNFPWKKSQTEKLSFPEFSKNFNYKGGIIRKDGTEIPATTNFGIVTGYDNLQCIDVDLKVLKSAKERKEFWDEYINFLDDNIFDFYNKVVIYKTQSDGYHIFFKCEEIEGNKKLAVLEGYTEAIIETRATGGYCFVYPNNQYNKRSYLDIEYISIEDRDIILSCSRVYNFVKEVEPIEVSKNDYVESNLTPWDDYNQKHNIFDVISSDFTIVASLAKKQVIKRHGATSPHSGYVFKDTGFMYLFSTGTCYPHEKLITPFTAYAYKNHNGDYSAASKDLYSNGYGSRLVKEFPKEIPKEIVEKIETKEFPLDIFPREIQLYILESKTKLMLNEDFMASSFLWMISVIIGNSLKIEAKKGWVESCTLFLSLVGQAGLGKTPSINNIIFPLKKINKKRIEDYFQKFEEYQDYILLSKKDQKNTIPIDKPKRKQLLASDTTIEALISLHNESKNAIGVFKDELDGWFKDMNKYREGSDKQQWLSIWSNESIIVNRLSRDDLYISSPFIPVLGGIQPEILDSHFTNENISSGFIDRFLFSYPSNLKAEQFNNDELPEKLTEWYENTILKMNDTISHTIKKDDNNEIIPFICRLDPEANIEWIRVFNKYVDLQNSENEPEMFKSMIAKIKTYIPRLALIIHFIDCYFNDVNIKEVKVSADTIKKAEKLVEYFVLQFKKIKTEGLENKDFSDIKSGKTIEDVFETLKKLIAAKGVDNINKSKLAKDFNVSRVTINNWVKKIENK